ncbi:hypothetical protein BVX93_00680, partial [bacterium B13(2017)]
SILFPIILKKVGSRTFTWAILIDHSLSRVKDWVWNASKIVEKIKDKFGGERNAWAMVIFQGIETITTKWIDDAEKEIADIYKITNNYYGALQVFLRYKKPIEQSKKLTKKVDQIYKDVGGKEFAWRIVLRFTYDDIDDWVEKALIRVNEIDSKTHGEGNAWKLIFNIGLDNTTDKVINDCLKKVRKHVKELGSEAKVWQVIVNQGLKSVDEWIENNRTIIDQIAEQRGVSKERAWSIHLKKRINIVPEKQPSKT